MLKREWDKASTPLGSLELKLLHSNKMAAKQFPLPPTAPPPLPKLQKSMVAKRGSMWLASRFREPFHEQHEGVPL